MESIENLPRIYIILPVHNRCDITLSFVKCLKSQTYKNFDLILVDDGSADGTSEAVAHEISSAKIIRGRGDWWWAGGLQKGIDWVKSNDKKVKQDDIVLMINDDVSFDKNFLEEGVKSLRQNNGHLLKAEGYSIQRKELISRGVKANLWSLKFEPAKDSLEINCLSTRGLFFKVSTLYEIGDFYPNRLPHYLSDYEYTIRAFRKGYKLFTNPEVKLFYDEETTGYQPFKELNFILFLKKYFSRKSPVNPLTWSNFVILACPKPIIPVLLSKIWFGATLTIIKRFILINFLRFFRSEKLT